MHYLANTFADRLKPRFGIPSVKPEIGESFDDYNNLWLVDACTVLHRDGHITKGSPASVTHDALIEYNRRHMSPVAFADYYADDPTECGFSPDAA